MSLLRKQESKPRPPGKSWEPSNHWIPVFTGMTPICGIVLFTYRSRLRRKKLESREFDTFILTDLGMVPEDKEMEIILRELTPKDRRYKYRSFYAMALISKSETKYPDRLWVRLGRGQLQEKPWSVKIVKEINKFA